MTQLWNQFLNQTNCTNIACVRAAKPETIIAANRWFFTEAPSGGFPGPNISFTPILDDNLVKDVPLRVLGNDVANSSVSNVKRVISGNMKNEGAASTIGKMDQIIIVQMSDSKQANSKAGMSSSSSLPARHPNPQFAKLNLSMVPLMVLEQVFQPTQP